MTKIKIAVASVMLLALSACGTMGKVEEPVASFTVIDCFTAGGTIVKPDGAPMCKHKDESLQPIQ